MLKQGVGRGIYGGREELLEKGKKAPSQRGDSNVWFLAMFKGRGEKLRRESTNKSVEGSAIYTAMSRIHLRNINLGKEARIEDGEW